VGEGFNVIGKAVKKHNGDVGLSFDGDADRMFVADENGDIVRPDIILALVAKALLVKNPGASIVYNLTCSHTVPEVVDASGGKAVRSRTGTAYIKDAMINNKAIFGGEVSAHYYFKDNYFADSGLLAFLILMEVLSESGEKLSAMAKKFDTYAYQVEINRRVEDRDAVIEEIKEKYADGKHDELDGLTVEYEDYWFNLRKSNTEPLIRLVVEAKTEELKKQKVEELLAIIGGENE
ncbi:MAG: phosphomannomutase/phosphoglucomutase, partial [Candidatus Jacksonbacteria bacterium]|nr:phosphomannomutase/phosphoglucomutase [Candidatus Jacksonbacteria bacterium]